MLEACGGLVTGAVAERLGGYGMVCSAYAGRGPPSQDAVRMFNFPWAMRESLCCASLERLSAAASADGGSTPAKQAAQPPLDIPASSAAAASVGAQDIGTSTPQDGNGCAFPAAADAVQESLVGVSSTGPSQAVPWAHGLDHGPEAACNSLPAAAFTASGPQATSRAGLSPYADDSVPHTGANGLPPPDAGRAQQSVPAAAKKEQIDSVSDAGRVPRNMEPKRCITSVPTARDEQLRALLRPGFGSCIIAAPTLQPLAAVQRLLPLLAPSAFFVVFSPFLQPLAEAMAALQASKAAANLQLQACSTHGTPKRCIVFSLLRIKVLLASASVQIES